MKASLWIIFLAFVSCVLFGCFGHQHGDRESDQLLTTLEKDLSTQLERNSPLVNTTRNSRAQFENALLNIRGGAMYGPKILFACIQKDPAANPHPFLHVALISTEGKPAKLHIKHIDDPFETAKRFTIFDKDLPSYYPVDWGMMAYYIEVVDHIGKTQDWIKRHKGFLDFFSQEALRELGSYRIAIEDENGRVSDFVEIEDMR